MTRHWTRQAEGVHKLRLWRLNLYFRAPQASRHKCDPRKPCGCRFVGRARGWELWARWQTYPT